MDIDLLRQVDPRLRTLDRRHRASLGGEPIPRIVFARP